MSSPNVLFVMTDQQRFDTIAALGNRHIYTPNLDRLARRGLAFSNAYSTCPVCVPARYTIRTGCEPPTTRIFSNERSAPAAGQSQTMEGRCGPYLARTIGALGYRTFGIGKFHTQPWDEDLGYEVHLHSEELYATPEQRGRDAYAGWIAREHPSYAHIEALMGERTEMYYMPQASPLPEELGVESWAADRAVEQIAARDDRPYFGFVSFIGPHPPFAPPIPFNRLYDPDRMPDPVPGDPAVDELDEQIPWMNYGIWADDVSDARARSLKARYYGEISYIDGCLGRMLDAVDASPDGANTLICFFSDHGDHLGDHGAWQKESYFDPSCHVPFLLSWPERLPAGEVREEIVCLTDLFGIATSAAGVPEPRDGVDVLGMIAGAAAPRSTLVGLYGEPGTPLFKLMVRTPAWKYIFLANGGGELLFDVAVDPGELRNLAQVRPDVISQMRSKATGACAREGTGGALAGDDLVTFPLRERERTRIYQFHHLGGAGCFPDRPEDALAGRGRRQARSSDLL
jgi:arylsulfatase